MINEQNKQRDDFAPWLAGMAVLAVSFTVAAVLVYLAHLLFS